MSVKSEKTKLNPLPHNPEGGVRGRFPSWLHRKLPQGGNLFKTGSILGKTRLSTVCEESKCSNRFECFSRKTATFLVLGSECTRACGFCDIDFSKTPKAPEADEPQRLAEAVRDLGLKHVVITMVARDDLSDGGAAHLAEIVREVRRKQEGVTIEILTSDFAGNTDAWDTILAVEPEIYNYNIETVRELTPRIRHKATYDRTLTLLSYAKKSGKARFIKSGIMVGLGETKEQMFQTLRDLKQAGVDIVTIGQYLQASKQKLLVKEFVHPDIFAEYAAFGKSIGLLEVYAGPLVRSSYNADQLLQKIG